MLMEKVFEPLTLINGVIIKNRLYKGVMSEGMADKTHRPTQELINAYKSWAEGGIGISYYEQQIRRLGNHQPPKVHHNAWSPLFGMATAHGPYAFMRRRR